MNIGTSLKTISKNQLCSFVGTGGYVELAETDVLSDGSIVTAAAILPLLNSGNDKGEGILPPGYQKVEFLESSGTQYINTGIVKSGEYRARFEYAAPPYFNNGIMFGRKYKYQGVWYEKLFAFYPTIYFGRFAHWSSLSYILPMNFSTTGYDGTARNVLETTSEADVVILNGETVYLSNLGNTRNTENPLNVPIYVLKDTSGTKLFAFTIFNESGLADIDLIPVLDTTGTPCMYDKVNRKCFYNAGTGHFRVGIATLQQAREFQLPDNTGNAVRVLSVSLPHEARTDFITQNHLDYLTSLNWSINVQYRDGDVPSNYTKVDFLESTGTQYLRLPDLSIASDDSANLDFSVSAYSGASADGVLSAYKFDSGEKLRVFLTDPTGGLTVACAWGGATIGGKKISRNEKLSLFLSAGEIKLNGTQVATPQAATFSYTDFVLFTQLVLGKFWNSLIKLFSFSVPGKCRLIPALRNSDGVPGMFDTVSKQFFENSGTGAFVVGIKTLNDTRLLDKVLPVVPSGSTYSITLSLPVEASTDAPAQKALQDLVARGWSINIQYREAEIPAGYAKVSFLESSGTQYIDTGIVTDGKYTITATLRGNNVKSPYDIWGRRGSNGASHAQRFKRTYWLIAFYYVWGGQLSEWQHDSAQVHEYIVTEGQKNIIVDGKNFNLNALNTASVNASNPSGKTHYLFSANGGIKGQVCFYSFRMQDGSGSTVLDLIPVINTAGVPGMYDKVSKQFFENVGTGRFRVGLASKEAVRNLYLEPNVPAGTTINLSVPAGTTEEDTRILKENNPNYTFNIQYRS